MSEKDRNWVKGQFKLARVSQEVGDAVLALLDAWDEIEISELGVAAALEAFSHLARGHALVPENAEETWVQAQAGFIRVGDEIRVKHDAFGGKAGETHNGRRGRIIAIRSGDVVVRSTDDREPFLDGVHYPATKLEKRVR